ncbi:transcription antitermination factor NusB [Fannyhessea vaginae]|uniref:transcription antitermination factor NusB n=1 Tax=Fannyhessea vaginae TaxID=82135 RepID=UPI00288A08A7|nr:transcription antitermination factor NusB [Fannyhessea vaginae]
MPKKVQFAGRTLARSQALQLMFQAESRNMQVCDVLATNYLLSEGPLDDFGKRLALGADELRDKLDALISRVITNWNLNRLLSVDRNILRLALYEMIKVDDVDIAVTINESVNLAKAYGTDESSHFVNGVLGQVARMMENGRDVLEDVSTPDESVSMSSDRDSSAAQNTVDDPVSTPTTEDVPAEDADSDAACAHDANASHKTQLTDADITSDSDVRACVRSAVDEFLSHKDNVLKL